ncbi:MAG: sugar ABC transporter permease [Candidatus Dormiibacterota bacterium]
MSTRRPAPQLSRMLGRDWRIAWLFLLPLLVVIVSMVAYPFVTGILLSFQHLVVGGTASWVGLGNYRELLAGSAYGSLFRQSVLISILYTAVAIAVKLVLGMAAALLLNERFRGRMLMRTIIFLPWALPTVIVALTWAWIYQGTPDGLINYVLIQYFHVTSLVQFLADPRLALWSVVLVVIWQGMPFYAMMFIAALQAIPQEQYEAAAIDGAGIMQRYWHITLPSLKPAIMITALLSAIWTANSVNFVYILTEGGPLNATMTFPMLAYQIGLNGARELGTAATVSVIYLPAFVVLIYFLTKRMLGGSGVAA